MKHYVLGFIFNKDCTKVLLVKKRKPEWQKGRWNGIGGKIEDTDENALAAMNRESLEETGTCTWGFVHTVTFICPGGTVYVFYGNSGDEEIRFEQKEEEQLLTWDIASLPSTVMSNLKWIIPLCLADVKYPIMVEQVNLGI